MALVVTYGVACASTTTCEIEGAGASGHVLADNRRRVCTGDALHEPVSHRARVQHRLRRREGLRVAEFQLVSVNDCDGGSRGEGGGRGGSAVVKVRECL